MLWKTGLSSATRIFILPSRSVIGQLRVFFKFAPQTGTTLPCPILRVRGIRSQAGNSVNGFGHGISGRPESFVHDPAFAQPAEGKFSSPGSTKIGHVRTSPATWPH